MKRTNAMKWVGCVIGAMLLSVSASGQYKQPVPEGFVRLDADEIKTGAIFGDPSKPGIYVTRNLFAPGRGSHPHFHDQARYITVIKGTWWVGSGPKFDKDATTPVPAGSFVVHHANQIHWDGAKDEEVIVQIMGIGPSATIRVDESGKPKN